MIRQTFSCDICGADKKESNHWFVALERDGEIRLGTWAALGRRRRGALHLCGQKCLYKLVDDFFVRRAVDARSHADVEMERSPASRLGTSVLDSEAEFAEVESSARLIPTPPTRVNRDATPTLSVAVDTRAANPVIKPHTAQHNPNPSRATGSRISGKETAQPGKSTIVARAASPQAAPAIQSVAARRAAPVAAPAATAATRSKRPSRMVSRAISRAAAIAPHPVASGTAASVFSASRAQDRPNPQPADTESSALSAPTVSVLRSQSAQSRENQPAIATQAIAAHRQESASDRHRASDAWQRERARERSGSTVQPRSNAATNERSVTGSRMLPSRIESRLHPILRPRALEA